MMNFQVQFSVSPYLLLLLIPALFLTFFFYFRLGKRIRRQGNRIAAVILHVFVMVFAVTALSGMYFSWDEENIENELVIMTDASYTSEYAKARSDAFIKEVLEANNGRSKVAIVKFGYDQVLALGMGDHSPDKAFELYQNSPDPDATATDICSALTYVWDPYKNTSGGEGGTPIIEEPALARILLLSDGLQTDRDAMSVARLINLDGIRIDTAFYPTNPETDAWVVGAAFPEKKFGLEEEFTLELSVRSNFEGSVAFNVTDNGTQTYAGNSDVQTGLNSLKIPYKFSTAGHHELKFDLTSESDKLQENNRYFTYYDMEIDSSVLVVEKYRNEGKYVADLIKSNKDSGIVNVRTVGISEFTQMTLDQMEFHDEIVLVNVANSDLPETFVPLLQEYVSTRGGGLFTVGGAERDAEGNVVMTTNEQGQTVPLPHAYNAEDLKGTLFHSMLPVEISAYTPPVAVAIILDRSGSMRDSLKLDAAVPLAIASLDALSPRDYACVIGLNDYFSGTTSLTPMTRRGDIENSIRDIASSFGGGTNYTLTIEHACRALATMNVERRHIIFFTDGEPGESNDYDYASVMQGFNESYGITISIVLVDDSTDRYVQGLAEAGQGEIYNLTRSDLDNISKLIKGAINVSELSGVMEEEYVPELGVRSPVVDGVTQTDLDGIKMGGVYASRLKSTKKAADPLRTEYGPLYAQWAYGNGKVGSFMCDLSGYYSENFLLSNVGKKILKNMIATLMPLADLKTRSLDAELIEDNYRTQVSVFDYGEEEDHKLVAFVKTPSSAGGKIEKFDLSEESANGNRFTFENRDVGIYDVYILEVPRSLNIFAVQSVGDIEERNIFAILHTYRAFHYSEEYDPMKDPFAEGKKLMIELSSREDAEGEQKLITDPDVLLSSLIRLHKTYDPRVWFVLAALILFVLEIALRKFKFDWLKRLFSDTAKQIRKMKKSKRG